MSSNRPFPTDAPPPPTTDRNIRERGYRDALAIVYWNTSPKQPPSISRGQVMAHTETIGHDAEMVRLAVQAAVENDDLIAVSRDGTRRYVSPDDERLRRALAAEADRDEPDRQVISRLNAHRARIRRGDHDA